MFRLLSLASLLTAFSCAALAEEPRQLDPDRLKQFREKLGDPEKLKELREKLGKGRGTGDVSDLKTMTWKVGDVTREALVYVPPSNGKKHPLVFAWHGHGGKMAFSAKQFAFHQHWPEAICVYPQGLPTAVPKIDPEGKMPGWQKYIGDQQDRDLAFFDAMLKTLKAEHAVDAKRIYSAGHSNGGYFSYVLWPARGDALAAVAPVAACLSVRDVKLQKPLPVLHVAGEKDPLVSFASQERTMEQIRKINGCDPTGKPAGPNCTEYSSRNGPPVVTFIHSGAHNIPKGAPERIVQFFKEHAQP